MNTDFYKKEYKENVRVWQRLQDSYEGEEAVKNHDKLVFAVSTDETEDMFEYYLPPLAGMLSSNNKKRAYYTYLLYGNWYAAYGRTINTYLNMLTAKKALADLPTELKDIGIEKTIRKIILQVLLKNRCCVLIDAPSADDVGIDSLTSITVEDANRLKLYPTPVVYNAEDIVFWKDDNSLVVLKEQAKQYGVGKNGLPIETIIDKLRVLDITEGVYRQRLLVEEKGKLVEEFSINPIINGKTLDYIPLFPLNSEGVSWDIIPSFTKPISDVNIAHFRNSASYERSLILTGSPTLAIAGPLMQEDNGGKLNGSKPRYIQLGSAAVLRLRAGSTADYLEYSGQGVKPLSEAMKEKEAIMSRLGADVIDPGKKGVESPEAMQISSKGENSLLGSLAVSLSESLSFILSKAYNKKITIELNKDYDLTKIDPTYITTLGNELVSGHISWETYFYNIQKGEVTPPGVTSEEELGKILNDQVRSEEPGTNASTDNTQTEQDDQGTINEPTNTVQLNGAQVTSAMDIVKSVIAGELPIESARESLQILFNMDIETANRMLSGVKK